MSFDRYRCVLDRIFPFSKLLEYQRRFRFRKYRTAFGSDEKKYESKNGGVFRRSFPTVFIPIGRAQQRLESWGRSQQVGEGGCRA